MATTLLFPENPEALILAINPERSKCFIFGSKVFTDENRKALAFTFYLN